MALDLFIKNGLVYTEAGFRKLNIGVRGEKIAVLVVSDQVFNAPKTIDARGMHIFPGFIAHHVHLHEPGVEYKEDFYNESCAFANSGVTMVCPQPDLKSDSLRGSILDFSYDIPPDAYKDYDDTDYRFADEYVLGDYFGHILISQANEGDYSYEKLVDITSRNFAKTMGFYPRKGAILVDTDADFTIVDMNEKWTISKDDIVHSKTQTIPDIGRKLHGKAKYTILRGRVIMENGVVDCAPGYGKFIKPGE